MLYRISMKITDLHNKKIAILGFGKEGRSTLEFLLRQGIEDITVLDKNDIQLSQENAWVSYIFWEHYVDWLSQYDIIFKSPWVSPFSDSLRSYREKFISQTELFFSNYNGKVIGITGTKWKSTCSTLLYECLTAGWYDVKLVWNIGSPVLDEVDIQRGKEYDYVIYELSSYMLQDFSPKLEVWLLNNIYPCHLDWHFDSFNIYREAKVNILRNAEVKIIHSDLIGDSEILSVEGEKTLFDTKGEYTFEKDTFLIRWSQVYEWEIKLLWEHNKKNICAVIALLDMVIWDVQKISYILEEVLPVFGGLPNRIEDIGTYEGIRFINDAIATTPESTMAAIHTFWDKLQSLFLGGENSGFEFAELRKTILESDIQNIIAFPDTSIQIFPEIEMRDYGKAFEIEIEWKILQCIKTRSMKAGVDFAFRTTFPGKVALLSCAAPSFSLWSNYLEKAEQFKKSVREYL